MWSEAYDRIDERNEDSLNCIMQEISFTLLTFWQILPSLLKCNFYEWKTNDAVSKTQTWGLRFEHSNRIFFRLVLGFFLSFSFSFSFVALWYSLTNSSENIFCMGILDKNAYQKLSFFVDLYLGRFCMDSI